jgi:lipopolysaccharide heptosyltransferase II
LADTARAAARLIGLRVIGRFLGARASRPPSQGRILLIRPDHLGDALLAAPTGLALRDALPEARIDWLVGPWAAEVIRRAPHADEILTCEFPGFTRRTKQSPWEPYLVLAREARRLRARGYDLALILRPDHWWGSLLATAAGVPCRLGYGVEACRPFLTHQLPLDPTTHSVDQGLALARLAGRVIDSGSEIRDFEPRFDVGPAERAWARRALEEAGDARQGPIVAIHPGSGAAVKNWLPERWGELVTAIERRSGARVLLTGSEAETSLVQQIADRPDTQPLILSGRTTLGQLAALFEASSLVVGGDSGPLHLATTVGTPTVRLYGPTDPTRFGPRGDRAAHHIVRATLPCQPCGNIVAPPCGATTTPACLRVVTVPHVVDAVRQVLAHRVSPLPLGEG